MLIRFWEIRKFLTNGLRESLCIIYCQHFKAIGEELLENLDFEQTNSHIFIYINYLSIFYLSFFQINFFCVFSLLSISGPSFIIVSFLFIFLKLGNFKNYFTAPSTEKPRLVVEFSLFFGVGRYLFAVFSKQKFTVFLFLSL
jgi:hypothetical protein